MPTVLVVDDERQIATIARDYLTRAIDTIADWLDEKLNK